MIKESATTLILLLLSFLIAWTNMFLVSWPLKEASKEIVTVALSLQLLNYQTKLAGLIILLVLFPTSYPLVLGILACSLLSIWPLYRLREEGGEGGSKE